MSKKASIVIAAIVAVFIFGMIALAVPREQPWPPEIAWPAERLTSVQAEELSDALVLLEDELKKDLDRNRGSGSANIIGTWQRATVGRKYAHMLRFLDIIAARSNINARFLYSLTNFAYDIDDLSEHGDILISGAIDGKDLIVTLESMGNGGTKRVIIYP